MAQEPTRRLFGTDGIRGRANNGLLTVDLAMRVGQAAGLVFRRGDHRHRVLIGKDTRLSGYMIEAALVAGFTSAGMDVLLTGPIPTPALAMLTASMRADLGVMISASHNLFADNGIKLFDPSGFKLSDTKELEIEMLVDADLSKRLAQGENLGRAKRIDDAQGRYIEAVKRTLPRGVSLEGLRVVIDCAHGAAYKVAPQVLRELGAEVIAIGVEPNGYNINAMCGSTLPEAMAATVREYRANVGIALDGDADRVVMADEEGTIIDGDRLLATIATSLYQQGRLSDGGVVGTVMSNFGLENYFTGLNIPFHRASVGDRHVLEAMGKRGSNVGGEQSGHIILSDHATTGDGLVAALQVLAASSPNSSGNSKLSETIHLFEQMPQVLVNVEHYGRDLLDLTIVQDAITSAERSLGTTGRLVIRFSGTEPLVRVMGECEDADFLQEVVDKLVGVMREAAH